MLNHVQGNGAEFKLSSAIAGLLDGKVLKPLGLQYPVHLGLAGGFAELHRGNRPAGPGKLDDNPVGAKELDNRLIGAEEVNPLADDVQHPFHLLGIGA